MLSKKDFFTLFGLKLKPRKSKLAKSRKAVKARKATKVGKARKTVALRKAKIGGKVRTIYRSALGARFYRTSAGKVYLSKPRKATKAGKARKGAHTAP